MIWYKLGAACKAKMAKVGTPKAKPMGSAVVDLRSAVGQAKRDPNDGRAIMSGSHRIMAESRDAGAASLSVHRRHVW